MIDEDDFSDAAAPKSDQLNADDLTVGPRTITVTHAKQTFDDGVKKISVYFHGDEGRPYKPCKTMLRVIFEAWGSRGSGWVGKSMTLYRDPLVKYGPQQTGGIRISHMSHIPKDFTTPVTVTRGKRTGWRVVKLENMPPPPAAAPKPQPAASAPPPAAMEAANNGTAAFGAWWKANPDLRAACAPHLEALKAACAKADAMDADPFGLPAASDIDAQIRAELAARDAAMEGGV